MSGAKKQKAATERFVACLGAAALLYPKDPTVAYLQELVKNNSLKPIVRHYSHMLEWLPK